MSQHTDQPGDFAGAAADEGAAGAQSGLLARDEAEPPPPGPPPKSTGPLPLLRWGWRQLTSMRTALVLLFLLALASVPGSVLPQRPRSPDEVSQFFERYPQLAPILDQLWLFNVFASPWFAAVYLLLFVSLTGCVIPRSWRHAKAARARPPRTPRNLTRLPLSRRWETDAAAADVVRTARSVLARKRFRVEAGQESVAAEKGYLHETGNLVFHLALLALLVVVAAGQLLAYNGKVLVTEGEAFANTRAAYSSYDAGSLAGPSSMQPFTLSLREFHASYVRGGPERGQPRNFAAEVRYRPSPTSPPRSTVLQVNEPLVMGSSKVYLMAHGYAPTFVVRDGAGNVAFRGPVPFLPRNDGNLTSDGVVKAPDAEPNQLAFAGIFTPTTIPSRGPVSAFPAPVYPTATLLAYQGPLPVSSGETGSVYELDTAGLTRLASQRLTPGETMKLPGGAGSITLTGYKEWAGLRITDDPTKEWVLASALLVVASLVLTLGIRRRRVWVRAWPGPQGRTVVEVGGLTRGDGARSFDDEFAAITDQLRSRSTQNRE